MGFKRGDNTKRSGKSYMLYLICQSMENPEDIMIAKRHWSHDRKGYRKVDFSLVHSDGRLGIILSNEN